MGGRFYIVYPLIKESEKLDLKNVENGYDLLKQVFPRYSISMVHGKMKPAEKDAEMQLFKEGKTQIMMATTVIEVGVDVPNASVMVIENVRNVLAFRNYTSLRGQRRPGRRTIVLRADVVVQTQPGKPQTASKRWCAPTMASRLPKWICNCVAPAIWKEPSKAASVFTLKIANLGRDGEILQHARNQASDLLDEDPKLQKHENQILVYHLLRMKNTEFNWSSIS